MALSLDTSMHLLKYVGMLQLLVYNLQPNKHIIPTGRNENTRMFANNVAALLHSISSLILSLPPTLLFLSLSCRAGTQTLLK